MNFGNNTRKLRKSPAFQFLVLAVNHFVLMAYYDIDRLGSIRKVDRDNRSSYVFACHLSKPNKETFQ